MNFVIKLVLKSLGVDLETVSGWKSYTGGVIQFLTGLGGVAGGLVNIINELVKLGSPADFLTWLQAASHGQDNSVLAVSAALALCGKGLADIGLAHKHDKGAIAAAEAAPSQQPVPPPVAPPAAS